MGIFDIFTGGAERRAADANRALANTYQTKGTDFVNAGYNTARGDLNNALGAYTPLSALGEKYGTATDALLGTLGVGGKPADFSGYLKSSVYTTPLTAGLDAINRRRSMGGMLDSGNADQDAQKFGSNLAMGGLNTYLSSLGSFINPELSATSGAATGQAGVYGGLGTLATNNASDLTNLLGSATSANMSANNLQAQGEAAGAKNLLGLGTSVLGLGTGGGGTFGGNLLSGLGRLF